MKNLLITIPSFLIILGVVTMVAGNGVIVLQGKDNSKEILVKAGAMIQLSLKEQRGTGYSWQFDHLDEQHFEVVKTETKALAEKK